MLDDLACLQAEDVDDGKTGIATPHLSHALADDPCGKALRETRRSLDEIARAVGYESGPAFSKAFRRLYGEAPGRYRSGRAERI
jgi:AraC-like DNA-binding protein